MSFKLRNRYGIPGVLSIVALVFAMVGGAYAAKNALTGKEKREVAKIAKRFAGKTGATGPQGPQGLPGAKGLDGAPGDNGKSVTVSNSAPGCSEGGVTVEVEGSGETDEICNGDEGPQGVAGDPWTAGGTLPSGKTETGIYGVATGTGTVYQPLSFPIPLAAPLPTANLKINDGAKGEGDLTSGSPTIENLTVTKGTFTVGASITGPGIPAGTTITAVGASSLTLSANATTTETEVEVVEGNLPECENGVGPAASWSNPEADPGFLCAFAGSGTITGFQSPGPTAGSGQGVSGAILVIVNPSAARGGWAVTAP